MNGEGPYHWCNEHPEHPTGPGVRTRRAVDQLADGISRANPQYIDKLVRLVDAGILPRGEARQLLSALAPVRIDQP